MASKLHDAVSGRVLTPGPGQEDVADRLTATRAQIHHHEHEREYNAGENVSGVLKKREGSRSAVVDYWRFLISLVTSVIYFQSDRNDRFLRGFRVNVRDGAVFYWFFIAVRCVSAIFEFIYSDCIIPVPAFIFVTRVLKVIAFVPRNWIGHASSTCVN